MTGQPICLVTYPPDNGHQS